MIKWVAVLLMIMDHIGYYLGFLIPESVVICLRLIGRLSYPLFAYSIALGFLRTKNRKRYFVRMFLFAFFTQALLQATAYFTHSGTFINVLFTFSLAILFMASYELPGKKLEVFGHMVSPPLGTVIAFVSMLGILGLTVCFNPDYNLFGVLSVFVFYIIQKKVRKPELTLIHDRHAVKVLFVSFLGLNLAWALIQILFSMQPAYWAVMEVFSVISIGIILLDKPRKKPAGWEKYFFYFFYPVHMVLLMIVQFLFIHG